MILGEFKFWFKFLFKGVVFNEFFSIVGLYSGWIKVIVSDCIKIII